MDDLISRADLFNRLAILQVSSEVYAVIQEMPAVDAVAVVRCADCRHYDTHDHRCKHWNHGVMRSDFCSHAERKMMDDLISRKAAIDAFEEEG